MELREKGVILVKTSCPLHMQNLRVCGPAITPLSSTPVQSIRIRALLEERGRTVYDTIVQVVFLTYQEMIRV